jgi:hypothetical protein
MTHFDNIFTVLMALQPKFQKSIIKNIKQEKLLGLFCSYTRPKCILNVKRTPAGQDCPSALMTEAVIE